VVAQADTGAFVGIMDGHSGVRDDMVRGLARMSSLAPRTKRKSCVCGGVLVVWVGEDSGIDWVGAIEPLRTGSAYHLDQCDSYGLHAHMCSFHCACQICAVVCGHRC
jgi:hypothetical protein